MAVVEAFSTRGGGWRPTDRPSSLHSEEVAAAEQPSPSLSRTGDIGTSSCGF